MSNHKMITSGGGKSRSKIELYGNPPDDRGVAT